MLIAISQRSELNQHGARFDSLEHSYLEYFQQFGLSFIIIPNIPSMVSYYFNHFPIEGIILTGGHDVNPKIYGDEIEWPGISLERDDTEKEMLKMAVSQKLPVLGICRGLQMINVFFGGKLIRDINKKWNHLPASVHEVKIVDSEFKNLIGEKMDVNSYHNQAVTEETLSSQLKKFALSAEGFVEGLYHPTLPIVGVQWHPERKMPDEKINEKIISALMKKVFLKSEEKN